MDTIKNPNIFWLTGMSGSGKTTLANDVKERYENCGLSVRIIDGDVIRNDDKSKLGFGYEDVKTNNLRIAGICLDICSTFDIVIVPVISPYDSIRKEVRRVLSPIFHLIYLDSDIESLTLRDTKGLYASADRGEITDLIGYSERNPYETPLNADIVIGTGVNSSLDESREKLFNYVDCAINYK
jgi:adenylyl-sulfate kinase